MLLKILFRAIKFHELLAAIVLYFRKVHVELLKLHIKESKIYTEVTTHSLDLIPPKKPSKLILLFCMTIRVIDLGCP